MLSPDEQERAARFRFERHRDAYVASRGTLRQVLSRYLHVPAAEIRFAYGPHGKPSTTPVEGIPSPPGVEFNLSHSGEVALVAVTQGRRVGVDVERMRADLASEAIARRYFSPREVTALLALPESSRLAGFFACWCRKEAYLKARGDGLTHPLNAFDVTLAPHEPPQLLATRHGEDEAHRWKLHALEVGAEYAAALAVERFAEEEPPGSTHCWEWRSVG
jgi:4'-phosphopantetheinyl transferase